jgi:glyoxylase-like metal-dependent hydrolase (beta-lactamase superfamily II)
VKNWSAYCLWPNANPEFEVIIATDGQEFKVGKITIRALHTPGHTMESTTYLLIDENGKSIFLVFIGDYGRPDLAQNPSMTQEQLQEYYSIR